MREILQELSHFLDQGRDVVYCCLVETRGSTPQKAGAAMLVASNGSQRGTLGGGCVEAEVKQQALRLLNQGSAPQIVTFHLDNNYGWDDGLICGGRMSVLIDPITRENNTSRTYFQTYLHSAQSGSGLIETVAITPDGELAPGARFLFSGEHELLATTDRDTRADLANKYLPDLQQRPRPFTKSGLAHLTMLPRITLLIVGGGHVGQAVAKLASEADFNVWVLDDREAYCNRERFPKVERLFVEDIGVALKRLTQEGIGSSVYSIIVTRGHNHDEEALYHLAPTDAGYVGMIGSKRKIKLIYEDLLAKGISAEALEKVRAPLGFDIGSQTVPEIAISIVAELIAQRNTGSTVLPARSPISLSTL